MKKIASILLFFVIILGGIPMNLLKNIPEPNREMMIRRYFLFEPVKIVAENMNIDAELVKSRLQATRKLLRKQLEERGGS